MGISLNSLDSFLSIVSLLTQWNARLRTHILRSRTPLSSNVSLACSLSDITSRHHRIVPAETMLWASQEVIITFKQVQHLVLIKNSRTSEHRHVGYWTIIWHVTWISFLQGFYWLAQVANSVSPWRPSFSKLNCTKKTLWRCLDCLKTSLTQFAAVVHSGLRRSRAD